MAAGASEAKTIDSKASSTRSLSYVALVLTLIVACMYLFSALRGHPMAWPSTALLIALCASSVGGFMENRTMKRALTAVGLVFALIAIYGLLFR